MNLGQGLPTIWASWLSIVLFVSVEVLLFAIWRMGRLGLRSTVWAMAFLGLLGVLWVRPDIFGLLFPIPKTSPGGYVLWDALLLTITLIGSFFWFKTLRSEQHLAALTREMALEGASAQIESWAKSPRSGPRVAVVIPAKNEQSALPGVLASLKRNAAAVDQRAIVIDDGSNDWTGGIARDAGAITLRHAYALGIGGALTTGFLAALRARADIVVQMDADGQHDAGALPSIVGPILLGRADYVIASRLVDGTFPTLSTTRRAGIRIYTSLVRRMTGYSLTDLTSGYRAIRSVKLPTILSISESNWAIEQTLRAGRGGLSMVEVGVPGLPRQGGRSQFHDVSVFLLYHFRALAQIHRALNLENRAATPYLMEPSVQVAPVERPQHASPLSLSTSAASHAKVAAGHGPVPGRRS
ncbi:MAG: glycosyltransferase family 2 protein [Euryarchaeota archaeon]|nr:glycosyltransferase family 2 protein [Euryarchaeota archaeon]MDE2045147.1 glycosyltransferase family 2 protein [Thermoplasmata archaeon]